MQLSVIKKLVAEHTTEELKKAEAELMEGRPVPFPVEGKDEGEQLTHILAAIAVQEDIAKGTEPSLALRNYAKRVRDSIS